MMDRRFFLAAAAACAAMPARAQSRGAAGVASELAGKHPAEYYQRAQAMFQAGQREEAIFIFYLGQLRYRAHLAARPELPKSGDPALFGSLTEVVGRPLNQWGFGDLPMMDATLKSVAAYDIANPDTFTPPAQFPAAWQQQRAGIERLRQHMLANADKMRADRTANGLENRR
jgi:hypothetical protein